MSLDVTYMEVESSIHPFRDCHFAASFWSWLSDILQAQIDFFDP